MTAAEIMGLVLLPPHPRNEVGVRGLTASPFYSCSSAKGTLTALMLRTTHRQGGASTDSGPPSAHRLVSLSLWTALADPRVSWDVSASPTLAPRLQAPPAQRLLSYLSQLSETWGSGTFILAGQSETVARGPHSKYPELSKLALPPLKKKKKNQSEKKP